ncbi:MAG: TetR/AcrR family transcriptional regulator [Gammaproteobacteria bacterium]|nr:TetR/AcrR family transcriptional regulator [Gammaproteobacteria bacterium]
MRKKQKGTYHHGDLRHSLIAAAERLLVRKGVTALSLREVAKAAGVSHAAPHRHFRDKTALIEALAEQGFHRLRQGNEKAQTKYPTDPARQLVEAGMAYLSFAIEKPAIVHLMFGGVISLDDCSVELKQAADNAFESLVRIVRHGQEAGIYRKADVIDLTLTAWSVVYGLSLMITAGLLRERTRSQAQVKKLGETVADILLSGMLKR